MQNLPDSKLDLESKTEPSVVKAQNYMERGGTPHRKKCIGRGGHPTYFLDGGNNWDREKT